MHGVLTRGRVEHQKRFARSVRQLTRDNAVDFRQLVHEVGLVVQTARRVHDDNIAAACLCRRNRVEYHSRRVCALAVTDDVRARALRPDFELVGRRRTEGIRRRQHDLFALADVTRRQLADGSGLADAVDADDQNDRRLARNVERLVVEHIVGQHLAQQVAQLGRCRGLAQLGAFFHLGDDLRGGRRAHVGKNERFFQLLEKVGVDFDERREYAVERMAHRVRSFLESLLDFIKKSHVLLLYL